MFDVIPSREGWQARKNGQPVGRAYASEERAWAQVDRLKVQDNLTERSCMTCRKNFGSEGPHNRMCDPCRRTAARAVASVQRPTETKRKKA